MKKRLVLLALLPFALFSCGEDPEPETTTTATGDTTALADQPFDFDTLRGMYTGDFGGSQLRLVITYASEGHATGFNSVKGLQRNISGKVIPGAETIELELSEPGDDKNDGVFYLSVDRATLDMTGTWKPNNAKLKEKTFRLERVVMPEDENELTAGNFTQYFDYTGDSLGTFHFEDDGVCHYEYVVGDNDATAQTEDFTGTWSFKSGRLTIEWEENPVFPSRKSSFVPFIHENQAPQLIGEGRELEAEIW